MLAKPFKCKCRVRDAGNINQSFNFSKPCFSFDFESTQEHFNKLLNFSYRGESLADLASELQKCSKYIVFHFCYDPTKPFCSFPKHIYRQIWTHFDVPIDHMSFLFKNPSQFTQLRFNGICCDLDEHDFQITPKELLQFNRLTLSSLNCLLAKLNINIAVHERDLNKPFSANHAYKIQQSNSWVSYQESRAYFYLPKHFL